jgi:hypothetical protein
MQDLPSLWQDLTSAGSQDEFRTCPSPTVVAVDLIALGPVFAAKLQNRMTGRKGGTKWAIIFQSRLEARRDSRHIGRPAVAVSIATH